MKQRINVFISYAQKDYRFLEQLQEHLSPLKKGEGIGENIGVWCNADISAGTEWENTTQAQLNSAHIILLLISPAFIASDYCYSQEMKRAVERHNAGEARVIPVILRPVSWQEMPFGKLRPLPNHGKPVTKWSNRDDAFVNIAEGIRQAIGELVLKSNKRKKNFDVCLICAKDTEASVLRNVIASHCNAKFYRSFSKDYSYEYHYTTITNKKGEEITVQVSSQLEYGRHHAHTHLRPILEEFRPRFVGMTGVCAGDKRKVRLGDLVVADTAFIYEDDDISLRKKASYGINLYKSTIDKIYLLDTFEQWIQDFEDISYLEGNKCSALHIVPMASVNSVRRDDPFDKVQALVHNAVAIDMEGATFYRTIADFPYIHSLVVKGVCDYADQDKNDEHHDYASKISALYMLYFIQKYVTSDLLP